MSGPPANPHSRRSIKRGTGPSSGVVLPVDGYDGPIPVWPLSTDPSNAELELWRTLWRTPQAAEWARSHCWSAVGRLVMLSIIVEDPSRPSAALLGEVRQLEDRLGLSPLAMKRLSWTVGDKSNSGHLAPVTAIDRFKDL